MRCEQVYEMHLERMRLQKWNVQWSNEMCIFGVPERIIINEDWEAEWLGEK
jgi:hypothetical protein